MPVIDENNYTFTSADGETPIHVREWVPDCDINGVVQIAHGINEYIGRYADFARFLASKGFVVVGNDHLGHGESVRSPEYIGFFAMDEGWYKVVADMERLRQLTAAKWPEAPYFLFGHSMGSFLTRTYMIRYPGAPLAGVILSGTGHLCNEDAAAAIVRLAKRGMREFLLGHLSRENNTPELAAVTVRAALEEAGFGSEVRVTVAARDHATGAFPCIPAAAAR